MIFGTASWNVSLEPTGIRDQLPEPKGRGRQYGEGIVAFLRDFYLPGLVHGDYNSNRLKKGVPSWTQVQSVEVRCRPAPAL
jgi:hypothetical protein